MNDLPRYTWDQAHLLRLATARGFTVMGIAAPTVRGWAANGLITAVAKAPGGAHLYGISDVSEVAARTKHQPGRPRRLHIHQK